MHHCRNHTIVRDYINDDNDSTHPDNQAPARSLLHKSYINYIQLSLSKLEPVSYIDYMSCFSIQLRPIFSTQSRRVLTYAP